MRCKWRDDGGKGRGRVMRSHCMFMRLSPPPAPYPWPFLDLWQVLEQPLQGRLPEREGHCLVILGANTAITGLHIIKGGLRQGAVPPHDPHLVWALRPCEQAVGLLGCGSRARQGICTGGCMHIWVRLCGWV